MRVLVITVVHVPRDARIFERQIGAMRAAGVEVAYAAPWSAYGQAPPGDLTTFDVPRATGRSRLGAIRAVRQLLRRHASGFGLVILHDPELLLALVGSRVSTPVVWDVHEDAAASLVARPWVPALFRPLARRAIRVAERWAEGRLHLILAEEMYQERFTREHPVVPNAPVLPDDVEPPGDDRVVYLGRIARARGADELIALGQELRGEVTVELIGDTEADVARQVTVAAERGDIAWTDYLPNAEALDRVRGALAGLSLLHDLPNFRGSMPTKVLEYMGCGVPVITTPLPLARQVVEEADAGVVVPFGDVGATVAAVRELRRDADRRTSAGSRARQLVSERYSWAAEVPRFLERLRAWARPTLSLPRLSDSPAISVVIPARDSARTLERAVRSAIREPVDEVVIAVGPSSDDTVEVARGLAARESRVRVVRNPAGTTPAALNAAVDASRGDVIVRLDAHAELPPGYVGRAVADLRETGAANVGGRQRPVAESGFSRGVAAAMTSWAGAGGATYRTGRSPGPVDTVYLGVFRRAALEAVGGFDERMVRNQDYELNVRLREQGGTVWYDPELVVDYGPRGTVASLARQYFDYGRWKRVTLRLHPGSLRARQLAAPALVLGLGIAAVLAVALQQWWLVVLPSIGYLLLLAVAAIQAADAHRDAAATLLALGTMHLGWGLGFLVGPPRATLRPRGMGSKSR